MPSSDEIFKTFAIFQFVTAFLVTCKNADVQYSYWYLILSLRVTNTLALLCPIVEGGVYGLEIQESLIISNQLYDILRIRSGNMSKPFEQVCTWNNGKWHNYTCAMPVMVKTCSCYNLVRTVEQKPDNHLEWPYWVRWFTTRKAACLLFHTS